jgi:hypothetical protein
MNGGNIQMTLMFYKDETVNKSIEEYIAMKTRLLEIEVDDAIAGETNMQKEQDSANARRAVEDAVVSQEAQLKAREDVLKQREDDLALREEQLRQQQTAPQRDELEEEANNNILPNINEEEVTQTNSNIENRPEDQAQVPDNRSQEVLGQG